MFLLTDTKCISHRRPSENTDEMEMGWKSFQKRKLPLSFLENVSTIYLPWAKTGGKNNSTLSPYWIPMTFYCKVLFSEFPNDCRWPGRIASLCRSQSGEKLFLNFRISVKYSSSSGPRSLLPKVIGFATLMVGDRIWDELWIGSPLMPVPNLKISLGEGRSVFGTQPMVRDVLGLLSFSQPWILFFLLLLCIPQSSPTPHPLLLFHLHLGIVNWPCSWDPNSKTLTPDYIESDTPTTTGSLYKASYIFAIIYHNYTYLLINILYINKIASVLCNIYYSCRSCYPI